MDGVSSIVVLGFLGLLIVIAFSFKSADDMLAPPHRKNISEPSPPPIIGPPPYVIVCDTNFSTVTILLNPSVAKKDSVEEILKRLIAEKEQWESGNSNKQITAVSIIFSGDRQLIRGLLIQYTKNC